jgi:hypothetical protein
MILLVLPGMAEETRQSIEVRALWHEGGQYLGLVELAIELPKEVPHF